MIAGQTAQTIFTTGDREPIARKAMDEERDAYSSYVSHLGQASLDAVAPLFYRRVLSEHETVRISDTLVKVWGAGRGDWFPPTESARADVAEFEAEAFENSVPPPGEHEELAPWHPPAYRRVPSCYECPSSADASRPRMRMNSSRSASDNGPRMRRVSASRLACSSASLARPSSVSCK